MNDTELRGPHLGQSPEPHASTERPRDAEAFRVNSEVRETLRLLRPHALRHHAKARFGSRYDGGYICVDDFSGVDTALSLGIEQDASWDLDVAARGLTIYQFDHTVDAPAPDDPRMVFAKRRIAPEAGPDCESIASLVASHDKGNARPNMILKIDIENDEWAVFDATDGSVLARFAQIACELHAFEDLAQSEIRQRVARVFRKITEDFAVVHVHANNFAGSTVIANVFVPNVLEVTFANRRVYDLVETDEIFPGPLDAPCNSRRPDIHLGSFRF